MLKIDKNCADLLQNLPTCRPTEIYQEHRCAASLLENLQGKELGRNSRPSGAHDLKRPHTWVCLKIWYPWFHWTIFPLEMAIGHPWASQMRSCLGSFPFGGFLSWTKLPKCCHCLLQHLQLAFPKGTRHLSRVMIISAMPLCYGDLWNILKRSARSFDSFPPEVNTSYADLPSLWSSVERIQSGQSSECKQALSMWSKRLAWRKNCKMKLLNDHASKILSVRLSITVGIKLQTDKQASEASWPDSCPFEDVLSTDSWQLLATFGAHSFMKGISPTFKGISNTESLHVPPAQTC